MTLRGVSKTWNGMEWNIKYSMEYRKHGMEYGKHGMEYSQSIILNNHNHFPF